MSWRAARRRLGRALVAIAVALSGIACGKDPLVGGSCRKGLAECSLQCVDLEQDRSNCGACGRACASGESCSAGTCGPGSVNDASADGTTPDATDDDANGADARLDLGVADGPTDIAAPDASLDVAVSDGRLDAVVVDGQRDGAASDGSADASAPDGQSDGAAPDGPPDDGQSPDAPDAPTCTPPYNTPEHCGDCFTQCVAPTPLCGLQQGTFKCVAQCTPPLVACGSVCVNTASDETNCGMCGLTCPSGICQAGGCVGKGYGHQVIIGADYSDTTLLDSSAPVTMLGNAIFQNVAAMVRVLAYTEFADAAVVTRVEGWLNSMSTARGKSLTMSRTTDWTSVPQQLAVAQYQVFLVYDQALAPADQMATTGTLWNGAMSSFAKGGGIIVALDGGSAGRMRDLLTNGGLLDVTGETDVTGTQLNVDAPTDIVGQNLPNVFAAKRSTVAFTTTQMRDNYHVFVVTDATGMLPVVVHSVPRP